MKFNKIVQLFKSGSVSVTGMKGTGKDVLIGNVIARRGNDRNHSKDWKHTFYPFLQ